MVRVFKRKWRIVVMGCITVCIALLFVLCACGKNDHEVKQEEYLSSDMAKSVFFNMETQLENATNAKATYSYRSYYNSSYDISFMEISTVGTGNSQIVHFREQGYHNQKTMLAEGEPDRFLGDIRGESTR